MACCSYSKLQQWSHAGKQLQDEGFPVEDVELPAAELDALSQQGVALIVSIHLMEKQAGQSGTVDLPAKTSE